MALNVQLMQLRRQWGPKSPDLKIRALISTFAEQDCPVQAEAVKCWEAQLVESSKCECKSSREPVSIAQLPSEYLLREQWSTPATSPRA